jgi:hypothetical protein
MDPKIILLINRENELKKNCCTPGGFYQFPENIIRRHIYVMFMRDCQSKRMKELCHTRKYQSKESWCCCSDMVDCGCKAKSNSTGEQEGYTIMS